MAWVNKSRNEVCPFMHNKWIFVVLATAWRCVIHQGNSLFWCCQGDKLATCPCYCSSSPALQCFSWLLCAYAWDVLRAISWLCTEHCYLQLGHSSPSESLLNQCSVAQRTDLNWLLQGNGGVLTSACPACTRKTAPRRALLYFSKYRKTLWVRRT